jgi:hypothetical protein
MTDRVTPADLRELATRADQLALEVHAADQALRGSAGQVGYRLGGVAWRLRRAAEDITRTLDDLGRMRARETLRHPCCAKWGACPDHGNSLVSSGGWSWCRHPGCGRSWDWDRLGMPCTEPAAVRVLDALGGGGPMCHGHAMAAREQVVGSALVPIDDGEGSGDHA